jgi:beta-glucosidase
MVLLLLSACNKRLVTTESEILLMKDRHVPTSKMDRFLDSLMSEMTLAEKAGQCAQYTSGWQVTGPALDHNYQRWVKDGMVGSVFNAIGAEYNHKLQKLAVEESRLGIPLIFGLDVIHGFKTIFPQNIGSASSWDPEKIELSARIAATEAAAAGINWTFSPMVDIARDSRWGRVSEGAGEDPYLGSIYARAYVRGYQGETLNDLTTIAACAKHFAAYGAAQSGRDYNTVDMSERELRQTYLPPFQAAVEEGVWTFMAAFNEVSGVPATSNEFLMRKILRDEWGFKGFVVSDYTGVTELVPHGVAKDNKDAARLAMNAGNDMDMMGNAFRQYLEELVTEGKVRQSDVEDACRRILEVKYRLGLFDDPYRYCDVSREQKTILRQDFLEAAQDLAKHSIVLLKNEGEILPLKKDQKIALVGPFAADENHIIGNWAAAGDRNGIAVSIKEAFEKRDINFTYAKGCEMLGNSEEGFDEARKVAAESDIVLMVMGEPENMSGEATSRTELDLPGNQREFIEAMLETGKPIVLILMNGRPLTLEWEHEYIPAIVETWFTGTMGGPAIADVIFGDYNPSGRLTISFPRRVGQLPLYYNYKNTGRPQNDAIEAKYRSKYIDVANSPLYPFGYGLSYTDFDYSDVHLSSGILPANGSIDISVDVTNKGDRDGYEVVQLYLRDKVGSITRPMKELKGFQKVWLEAGQTKKVTISLTPEDLKFWDQSMNFVFEPGEFDVYVGHDSQTKNKATFLLQ